MVADVYDGVYLQQSIDDAVDFARANGLRVVFQGGIQGESWFLSGGLPFHLENLIRDSADIAVYAIAAGNGGLNGIGVVRQSPSV